MIDGLPARCQALLPDMVGLRRAFHRLPEIGLDLPRTQSLVASELGRLGIAHRAIGSGLIADLGDRGPRIGLRADMDALPIQEATGLEWSSTIPGAMHACGHDAHMAALLGAAAILREEEKRGSLDFRARLIFQPGEEGHFGALGMIKGGALEGLDAIEGGHMGNLSQELGPGEAGFLPGPMMAASDSFEASFVGSGGHGSAPHESPDPIAAFADFVQALAQFRARELDQRMPAVISVCMVRAGAANNVIPERLALGGTARSLDPGLRALLEKRIGEIGASVAALWRLSFDYHWLGGYPPLVNDTACAEAMEKAARFHLGASRVRRLGLPIMGGEDFAFYAELIPGAFWFLCSPASGDCGSFPHHNPRFDLGEAYLADAAVLHLSSAQALAARFSQAKTGSVPKP